MSKEIKFSARRTSGGNWDAISEDKKYWICAAKDKATILTEARALAQRHYPNCRTVVEFRE